MKLISLLMQTSAVVKPLIRPLRPDDFDQCLAISSTRHDFSPVEIERIRKAWAFLLPRDEMLGVAIEDVALSPPKIRAFGATVFVSDACMTRLKANPEPSALSRVLIKATNRHSEVLNWEQIGFYNSHQGLNLVVCHRGEIFGQSNDEFGALAASLVWSFQASHRGFNLREMLNEARGARELAWAIAGGNWVLRNDFSHFYESKPVPFPSETEHPYLIGASKEETAVNSALRCMFMFSPPRLAFSKRQKRVFLRAQHGLSNRAISRSLDIPESSVQNCFRAGYEKLKSHNALASHFGLEKLNNDDGAQGQRRLRFLSVLIEQMEEIRPWSCRTATAYQRE